MQTTVTPAHLRLEVELQSRLGSKMAVVCTGVDGDPDGLWPQERIAVAGAVPRRQREFAAGRIAARSAMQRLRAPVEAVPAHADRSPCWPENLIGSISHTADTCVAVVGRRNRCESVGIDIESEQGMDASLWDIICTPEERRELQGQAPSQQPLLATRLFVAKEAFYKWYYPQTRNLLEFQEVSLTWNSGGSNFEVSLQGDKIAANCAGHIFLLAGNVVAYCTTKVQAPPLHLFNANFHHAPD